jgi:hypothetical protein
MGRLQPFHTSTGTAYHDQSECSLGKRIPDERREPGTMGRPKCSRCMAIGWPLTNFHAPGTAYPEPVAALS